MSFTNDVFASILKLPQQCRDDHACQALCAASVHWRHVFGMCSLGGLVFAFSLVAAELRWSLVVPFALAGFIPAIIAHYQESKAQETLWRTAARILGCSEQEAVLRVAGIGARDDQ